jgi:hypothetical protein
VCTQHICVSNVYFIDFNQSYISWNAHVTTLSYRNLSIFLFFFCCDAIRYTHSPYAIFHVIGSGTFIYNQSP